MQRFEQGCLDSSIRLLPTTVILDTSFRDRYLIRLLDEVDMAIIQWGIFPVRSVMSSCSYTGRVPLTDSSSPTYQLLRFSWYSCNPFFPVGWVGLFIK